MKSKMTKTKAKEIALETMMLAIGTAYYKFADNEIYPDDVKDLVLHYIEQYGKRAAKALGQEYITY